MDLTSLAVSVVVVILVVLVMHRSKEGTVVPASSSLVLDATPDSPMGFGYKNAWFAIKTDDSSGVIETLGLDELLPANWCSGLTASYDHYDTHDLYLLRWRGGSLSSGRPWRTVGTQGDPTGVPPC